MTVLGNRACPFAEKGIGRPSRILLRVRRDDTAAGRFAVLTKQLAELTREVRFRRQVAAERSALLAQTTRTREELPLLVDVRLVPSA